MASPYSGRAVAGNPKLRMRKGSTLSTTCDGRNIQKPISVEKTFLCRFLYAGFDGLRRENRKFFAL
jgi:hypothetical protein